MAFETVADNLRESFRVVAGSRPAGEVRELPGVSIASANVEFQMFNAAFLSSPVTTEAELDRRILLAGMHFQARAQEWSFWVCEDWMAPRVRRRSRTAIEKHGLRHSTTLPGMVVERLAPAGGRLPDLEIRRVCAGPVRDAFCLIGSVCFHVPLVWFREVFEHACVWEKFVSWVGYLDGEPVSTTSVVMGAGAIGVYNVATLPGHQRRGYGERIMRHAVEEARREHPEAPVVLQSTAAGLRLYQRMGFRTVASVSVYAS